MNAPLNPNGQGSSTRPYLIRALHDWCLDNGFTPYLAVFVDEAVRVPMEYVKNREIVLNVSFDATSGLTLGNEFIEFKARFGGVARDILVPVDHVVAIYARENGQGMAFPVPMPSSTEGPGSRPEPAPSVAEAVPAPSVVSLPSAGPAVAGKRKPRRSEESGAVTPKPVRTARPAKAPMAVNPSQPTQPTQPPTPPAGGRPALKRVK
jgi:stringent starvation protein B